MDEGLLELLALRVAILEQPCRRVHTAANGAMMELVHHLAHFIIFLLLILSYRVRVAAERLHELVGHRAVGQLLPLFDYLSHD